MDILLGLWELHKNPEITYIVIPGLRIQQLFMLLGNLIQELRKLIRA
jgi:hypothetical protein